MTSPDSCLGAWLEGGGGSSPGLACAASSSFLCGRDMISVLSTFLLLVAGFLSSLMWWEFRREKEGTGRLSEPVRALRLAVGAVFGTLGASGAPLLPSACRLSPSPVLSSLLHPEVLTRAPGWGMPPRGRVRLAAGACHCSHGGRHRSPPGGAPAVGCGLMTPRPPPGRTCATREAWPSFLEPVLPAGGGRIIFTGKQVQAAVDTAALLSPCGHSQLPRARRRGL